MKSFSLACQSLALIFLISKCPAEESMVRVLVWDEQQPAQKQAYENYLGNTIAEYLSKPPGLRVISANINEPEKGLPMTLLDNSDVLNGKIGSGKVFYFRPGHETHPVYKQERPLQIISNAVKWLGHAASE